MIFSPEFLSLVSTGYVTSLFARVMVQAAGPTVDRSHLLASVGLDPAAETDPKVMLKDADYYDLLERIALETDVTDLPLKAAELLRPDHYGALGLAWKAALTLLGSLSRVERYARLWTSVVEYELRESATGTMYMVHRADPRRLGMRLSNEATLASTVSLARQVCPVPFSPEKVFFKHTAPKTLAHHEAYFDCPVQFGADTDALLLSPGSLSQPNKLGDEGITRFLLSHLESELGQIDRLSPLETETRDAIVRALSEGPPKMADIARSLGMSVRSYHRRLSKHGLTFQTITQDTRRELAEGLLRDDAHSLAEIAFLTGFSEQSAFTRAFKRWLGVTPAMYRKDKVTR